MAVKKFVPKNAKKKAEPIEFELGDALLKARPRISGMVLLRFIEATSALTEDGDEGSQADLIREITPFFKAALYPESFEKFSKIMDTPEEDDDVYEIEDIMEIVGWLAGEYANRPTSGSNK